MVSQRNQLDLDIFTVSEVLSGDECSQLIERAESVGFEAASVRTHSGPQMMTNIRNNDRVVLVDETLASVMWERVRQYLPELDGYEPCGVDRELRFYRYVPGQRFKRHVDGSVTNEQGHQSKLSYLIYLNSDSLGGATAFREYHEQDGERKVVEIIVQPMTGMALLFRHERKHEGTPVESGIKYVLRTDVFYRPKNDKQV